MSKLDLTTILRYLVQIPTENPPGKTDHIIKCLISEVFKEEEGFLNEIIPYKKGDVELKNLISTIGSGEKKIILSGHFDASDAGVLVQPKKPVPFVVFGPGDPSNTHKIDEFVELEQVFQATEYLTNALLQTYSKEKD